MASFSPLALTLPSLLGQEEGRDPSPYFGKDLPPEVPEVFAPGVVSLEGRFEQSFLFAPDGASLLFVVTNQDWSAFSLFAMTRSEGRWSDAAVAPFLGGDPSALTGCLSFAGDRAFFTASRPSYPPCDVWLTERAGPGWGSPRKLGPPISTEADEFEVSVARDGTLYFSSKRPGGLGDIDLYRAPLVDGGYPRAENLGPPINTSAGDDLPFITPDQSMLLFASDRPGGLGLRDLYVSFRAGDSWTAPENLGAPINGASWDIYPSLSPDGRALFFTRREAWQTTEDSDIYWVSASFLDRLRPEPSAEETEPAPLDREPGGDTARSAGGAD